MATSDEVLVKMREICLSLPDTRESTTWGKPHFRVGDRIFSGCGQEQGKLVIGFKLQMEHANAIIQDPRFRRAPYVGHKGWVSMEAESVKDWNEVRSLIIESYRLIAPKKSLAKLEGRAAAAPTVKKGIVRKALRRPAATRGGLESAAKARSAVKTPNSSKPPKKKLPRTKRRK